MTTNAHATDDKTTEPRPYADELEMLERVLEPLGTDRASELLDLAAAYLENVSPYTWISGQTEAGEEAAAVVWELGKPSPLNADRVVFALFDFPAESCAMAYCFAAVLDESSGQTVAFYYREKIYRPRYAVGPLSLEALYRELAFHLDVTERDDKPTNGKG